MLSAGGAGVITGTNGVNGPDVILARDPGGRFQALPAPGSGVLGAQETLFDPTAPAVQPIASSGHAEVFSAPSTSNPSATPLESCATTDLTGPASRSWLPTRPRPRSQRVLAISANSPANVYLLALTSDPSAGVQLFKREAAGAGFQWTQVTLDGGEGASYGAASGTGYTHLGPLHPEAASEGGFPAALSTPGAQPLTATAEGAWVDGAYTVGSGATSVQQRFTIHLTVTDGSTGPHATVHSWCAGATSGPLCDETVPAGLPTGGFRSVAFSDGSAYGSRIITGLSGGAILSLSGTTYARIAGIGDEALTLDPSAAFISPTEGWLGGAPPTHFTLQPSPDQLQAWPVPFREPLTAIAGEPGHTAGDIKARAVAVGSDGEVARFNPGQGWTAEPLLTAAGIRAVPRLRAVAWPSEQFTFAVGDQGAMWRWNAVTGVWEPDPGKPYNFNANLTGIAFDPANPDRGYAVGLGGVLLRYDKTWTQDTLPAGFQNADFTSITFAGSEAIVAFQAALPRNANGQPVGSGVDSGLLVNDGSGWQLDTQEQSVLTGPAGTAAPPVVNVVAGLGDGGAVAAGNGVLLERDSAGGPWRTGPRPAAGVFDHRRRRDPRWHRRACAAVSRSRGGQRRISESRSSALPPSVPSAHPARRCCSAHTIFPPTGGCSVRPPTGWQDVQRNAFPLPPALTGGIDDPRRDDQIQAVLLSAGWHPRVGGREVRTGIAADGRARHPQAQRRELLHTAGHLSLPTGEHTSDRRRARRHCLTLARRAGHASRWPAVRPASSGCADAGSTGRFRARRPGSTTRSPRLAGLNQAPLGARRAFIYTGGIVPPAFSSLRRDRPGGRQRDLLLRQPHRGRGEALCRSLPALSSRRGRSAVYRLAAFRAGLRTRPPGCGETSPGLLRVRTSQRRRRCTAVRVARHRRRRPPAATQAAGRPRSTERSPITRFCPPSWPSARAAHEADRRRRFAHADARRTVSTRTPPRQGASALAQTLVDDGASAYFFAQPSDRNAAVSDPERRNADPDPRHTAPARSATKAYAQPGNELRGERIPAGASVDAAHVDPVDQPRRRSPPG